MIFPNKLPKRKVHPSARFLLIGILLLIGFQVPLSACDVPVYRYALERWEASLYQAIIFHQGPLSAEHTKLLKYLDSLGNDEKRPVNIYFLFL